MVTSFALSVDLTTGPRIVVEFSWLSCDWLSLVIGVEDVSNTAMPGIRSAGSTRVEASFEPFP